MVKKKGISLTFQKTDLFLISAVFIFLVAVGFVIATNSGNPAVMGHSYNEIQTCSNGQILETIGGNWVCTDALVKKRIFVTSTTYTGNMKDSGGSIPDAPDGLTGADWKCMQRALAGGLTGTWKAVLGSKVVPTFQRIGYNWDELVNTHGDIVAQKTGCGYSATGVHGVPGPMFAPWGAGAEFGSNLCNPVKYDEFGNSVSGYVWSGSNDIGNSFWTGNYDDCDGWISASTSYLGLTGGGPTYANYNWIFDGGLPKCNNLYHIYCIEQ